MAEAETGVTLPEAKRCRAGSKEKFCPRSLEGSRALPTP